MSRRRAARWALTGVVSTGLCGVGISSAQPPLPSAVPSVNAVATKEAGPPVLIPRPPFAGAEVPPAPSILREEPKPIDLPTALQLAGVRNPQILLAQQRVVEADALRQLAAVQFLPSLNAGGNVNAHTGPLMTSTGEVVKVNRDSLYLGLGANAVGAGTVTIPGIVLAGNPAEGIYRALAARQVVRSREFGSVAVRNETLLRVAAAYLELLRAEGRRAVLLQTRAEVGEVARITANYAATGQGRQADADRAATELEQRNNELLQAESDVLTASARLCQLLDLDPSTRLHAAEAYVVPHPVVPEPIPLCELIAIALTQRPELGERRAAIRAALLELQGAKVLPFSPNLVLGYSAGSFGGGSNVATETQGQPRFDSFAGRQDVDAVVFWSLRNLGLGNVAQVRLAQSGVRSEQLREVAVLDRVRAEVAAAYARTHARFAQIEASERAVQTAGRAFRGDLTRIRNREGLPIEVLDSLRLLGRSRTQYLDAIVEYNLAHLELYVALGQPPADFLARPVPPVDVPVPSITPAPK